MSGHSKWANIRVRKTAMDAKRGKVFTRHAKLIEIAVRSSGNGDSTSNPSLRTALDNARADNVPNANIERAIKKGLGELKGEQMSEVVYAAYLPTVALAEVGGAGGAAFLIACITDNRNRTLANVKGIIHKHGGTWTDSASVLWMFERKGIVTAHKPGSAPTGATPSQGVGNLEELELALIDCGAEDLEATGETITVTTGPTDWAQIRDFLKRNGWEIDSSGLKYLPTQKQAVHDLETAQKIMAFMEALEEDEDVDEVHTNADIAAEVARQLG